MPLFERFASVFAANPSRLVRDGYINGLPGFVTIEGGNVLQTTALEIADGRIVAIYATRNPDKLQRVADTLH
jgi:RNA polymerase sigma-70 factor, ECF subfamily